MTYARPAGVFATALAVYVATMFPGLVAIGDTPKFQFVGAVLGTPHSPGYPVYMLLSWVFAQVPIGTLAYRMNLMSAVFGAVTVAALYGVLRLLGCRAWVAASGALAIGFGRVFWSQALLAEVYTLNSALFAGALVFLLRWGRTRRDGDLIAAIGCVAAGAAHHLTLVMTIPALTAYALTVDARHALSRRIVAWTLVFALASLGTYAYIWIRTAQGAPFLEVRAQSVSELVKIMRGDAFDQFLGQLSFREIVRSRAPLIAGWLWTELGLIGVALLVPGFIAFARRHRREAIVFGGAALPIIVFTLDYVVYDVEVFLLIPMIVLGVVGAVGLEAIVAAANQRVPSRTLRTAGAVCACILVAYVPYRMNRSVNDQHRHVYETELFDALFRSLPDRSAIVRENYPIDHMLVYKIVGEKAAGGRDIVLIAPSTAEVEERVAAGYHVYAFHDHRLDLEAAGVRFVDAELSLPTARSLVHILDTECLTMGYPIGEVVGFGAPPNAALTPPPFSPAIRTRR